MKRRDLLILTPSLLPAADAPDFRARTLAQASYTKAALKGKVVLIQFWATWCGFCRQDQPAVDELFMDGAAKGLEVLAVNYREAEPKVRAYLRHSPRMVPVVLATGTDLLDRFPAPGFPTYIVVNRQGQVAATAQGAQGRDGLSRLLARAGLTL